MRPPTILDIIQAVIDVAPSHPEVAVWWYARAGDADAPNLQLVLEPRDGTALDTAHIGSELAARLGSAPTAPAIRLHGGLGEPTTLYRLLTTN